MRRYLGSIAGWGLILFIAVWLLRDTDTPAGTDGHVVFLAIPLDAQPTRFDIAGSPRARVTLWLDTEAHWAQDPRALETAVLDYAIFDAAGQPLRRDRQWLTFRRSWATGEDPYLVPTDRGPDDTRDLFGNRIVVIELPEGATELHIALDPTREGHSGLAVVHADKEVERLDRLRGLLGADAEREAALAAQLGPFPWDEVPLAWREGVLDTDWTRLAPIEQRFEPVRITARSDRPHYEDAAAPALALMPGAVATWNLENTQRFEAQWTEHDGETPRLVHTLVRTLGEGLSEEQDLGMVDHVGPLEFGDGVRAVFIARAPDDEGEPVYIRAVTRGALRDRAWGDPPRWEHPDGSQRVAPDLTSLTAFRTRPDDPLVFPIPKEHEVRILARPRLDPNPLPGLALPVEEGGRWLELEVVANGASESVRRFAPGRPSAFERYTHGDDPASARVSEESEWFLPSAPNDWELRLTGESLDVAVFIKELRAPSDVPQPGYPLDELGEFLRVRYLPYARRTWRARFPEELDRLGEEHRYIRIDAQVRWTLPGTSRAPGEDYQVLEFPPPFELVAHADPGGSRSRLTKKRIPLEIADNGRLFVDYRVPVGQVGQTVAFRIGDETRTERLRAAGGTFRFEGLPAGTTRARVDTDGVFLANANGGRNWRVRRVWAMTRERPRSIPIPANAKGVSVHIARRKGEPGGVLRWQLSGTDLPVSTARREGLVTLREARGTAEVMSRDEATWVWTEPLTLRLEKRLEGQAARLDVWLEDRDEPVWIWASSTWAPRRPAFDERHWQMPGVFDR